MEFDITHEMYAPDDVNQIKFTSEQFADSAEIAALIDAYFAGELVINVQPDEVYILHFDEAGVVSIKGSCGNIIFDDLRIYAHFFETENGDALAITIDPNEVVNPTTNALEWTLASSFTTLKDSVLDNPILKNPIIELATADLSFVALQQVDNVNIFWNNFTYLAGKSIEGELALIGEIAFLKALLPDKLNATVTLDTVQAGDGIALTLVATAAGEIPLDFLALDGIELTFATVVKRPTTQAAPSDAPAEPTPPNIQISFTTDLLYGTRRQSIVAAIDLQTETAIVSFADVPDEQPQETAGLADYGALIGVDGLGQDAPSTLADTFYLSKLELALSFPQNILSLDKVAADIALNDEWEVVDGLVLGNPSVSMIWEKLDDNAAAISTQDTDAGTLPPNITVEIIGEIAI